MVKKSLTLFHEKFALQGSESRKKDIKKNQANKIKKNIKRENINKDLYTATKIIFCEKFYFEKNAS